VSRSFDSCAPRAYSCVRTLPGNAPRSLGLMQRLRRRRVLWRAFEETDVDGSGRIDLEELGQVSYAYLNIWLARIFIDTLDSIG
jgi:hypothetical protein